MKKRKNPFFEGKEAFSRGNFGLCIRFFQESLNSGNLDSFFELGNAFYRLGKYEKSKVHLMKSIMSNIRKNESYYILGKCSCKELNFEKAYGYFSKSGGIKDSYYKMGIILLRGKGVRMNSGSAYEFFKKGAQKGDAKCMLELSLMYKYGVGVDKNITKHQKWEMLAMKRMSEVKRIKRESKGRKFYLEESNRKKTKKPLLVIGMTVWIRVPGFEFWPAHVISFDDLTEEEKIVIEKGRDGKNFLAKFFNDNTYWWISNNDDNWKVFNPKLFEDNEDNLDSLYQDKVLKTAIVQALDYCKNNPIETNTNNNTPVKQQQEKTMVRLEKSLLDGLLDEIEGESEDDSPKELKKEEKRPFKPFDFSTSPIRDMKIPKINRKVTPIPLEKKNMEGGTQVILKKAIPLNWDKAEKNKYYIYSRGKIVSSRRFHDERYIYPDGFISFAIYKDTKVMLEVIDDRKRDDPVFIFSQITPDGKFVEKSGNGSTSIGRAWENATNLSTPDNLRSFFGLNDESLARLQSATRYCGSNKMVMELKEKERRTSKRDERRRHYYRYDRERRHDRERRERRDSSRGKSSSSDRDVRMKEKGSNGRTFREASSFRDSFDGFKKYDEKDVERIKLIDLKDDEKIKVDYSDKRIRQKINAKSKYFLEEIPTKKRKKK